jgi:hypothetical protein
VVALFLVALSPFLSGQELNRSVVGSAGSYFSAVNVGNLHWTVGEIVVDRTANGIVLERGFHHGLYELIATSTWTAPEVQLEVAVYPNPTADNVTLSGDWERLDRLRVTDLLGRPLSEFELPLERAEVSLDRYPSGTYFFTLLRAGQPLKSVRVVRR